MENFYSFRGISFLILMIGYVGLLGWSWWRLKQHGVRSHREKLPVAGFLALTLVTFSFLIFLGTEAGSAFSNSSYGSTDFPFFRFLGCALAIAALAIGLCSRGWRRISAAILSSVMVFVWTVFFVFGDVV